MLGRKAAKPDSQENDLEGSTLKGVGIRVDKTGNEESYEMM